MHPFFLRLAKQLQFLSPLRSRMVHRHDFFFWPEELHFLCGLMEKAVAKTGCVAEVGCAQGATSVFLNKHLQWATRYNGLRNDVRYHCFDTFSGFTPEHIAYEQTKRGKADQSFGDYRINSPEWFSYMLQVNGVKDVGVHAGDATKFDWSSIGSIGFCLLDVDLYLPTKALLPEVHRRLAPDGIIVVDDCQPSQIYDGARQAYVEYIAEQGLPEEIHHRKFGIIRGKNSSIPASA